MTECRGGVGGSPPDSHFTCPLLPQNSSGSCGVSGGGGASRSGSGSATLALPAPAAEWQRHQQQRRLFRFGLAPCGTELMKVANSALRR
jgi:hypothetical protein